MLEHKDHFHGSDLEKIEKIYGIKKEDITSFSANVNPLGISPLMRAALIDHIDVITSYPDREYTALRTRIGEYAKAPIQNILVGNGSTELISLFIQMEHPKKALILGPTYSEYEREISLGGGTCLYYPLKEEQDFILDVEDFKKYLNEALDLLDVDKSGLDQTDRELLLTIIQKFQGGPVGLDTLAAAIGEDAGTIEDVYEPYLLKNGFLQRTPRGRVASEKAYAHLGISPENEEK